MGVAVIFGIVVLVFLIRAISGVGGPPSYASICKRGVPARGILLSVSRLRTSASGTPPWRYEVRDCYMDIEIPGRAPYEANVSPFIPTNLVRDVLPGATVELRVDPKRPNLVAIVGPGAGFNSALLNSSTSQGMS